MTVRNPAPVGAASSPRPASPDRLALYRRLASFPSLGSYRAKFVAVAAAATFVPAIVLLAIVVLGAGRLGLLALVAVVALLALASFALLVRAVDGLLAPLALAETAIDDVAFGRPVARTDLPGTDTAAQVLRGVQALAQRAEREASAARDAGQRDELTGLLARSAGREVAQRMIDAETHKGRTVQVVVADVERFGAFNAKHGHGHGDAMLKVIAARIARVAGEGAVTMRWSGDAFVLVQSGPADDLPDARDLLGRPIVVKGADEPLTLAVGIATSAVKAPFDRLVADAEAALASARGR
jgi:diguanylate cyclase (GGDEF)-like protein